MRPPASKREERISTPSAMIVPEAKSTSQEIPMARLWVLSCVIIVVPLSAAEPAKKPTDEGLRQELPQRVKEDQEARKVMIEWLRNNKQELGKPVPPELEKVGK